MSGRKREIGASVVESYELGRKDERVLMVTKIRNLARTMSAADSVVALSIARALEREARASS